MTEISLAECVGSTGVFTDGDWVETKDQDPLGEVRLIQLADIGVGAFLNKSSRFLTLDTAKRLRCTFLEPGDILIARMPDPIGRACIFPGLSQPCATVVDVCVFRPDPRILHVNYAKWMINSPQFLKRIEGFVSGSTRQRISRGNLATLSIPLPVLEEQKRIAAILDQADELRRKRQRALDRLGQLGRAIFIEMFGDLRSNPNGYAVRRLGELARNEDGKRVPIKMADRDGIPGVYPYFGASGVIDFVDDFIFEGERLLIGEDGANLLARSSPLAFMARGKFWVNNHAHVLAYNECANLRFLEFFIETIDVSKYVSGSAQPKLTQKQLNNIEVPTPPLDEQNVFAERVGIIEERYQLFKQSCESMQALFTSLQHCAFRGELTTSGLKEVAA